MRRILFVLFALSAFTLTVSAADYKAKPVAAKKPRVQVQAHQPHAVQVLVPGHAFSVFGNPYAFALGGYGLGAYQQPSPVVAVVDTDGVVRLIELRQLRGYQPQLQSPLQYQLQLAYPPMYAPAPIPAPAPAQPRP